MSTINKYLKSPEVTGLAVTTKRLYNVALSYLNEFCKENEINSFVRFQSKVPDLIAWMDKKKLGGKSKQRYLTVIKIFLKWNGTPIEYTYKISNEEMKANKRKQLKRWFTELEIDLCLAHNFPRYFGKPITKVLLYKTIVRLLVETGARVRELANIKAEDVDIKESIVWLYESKTEPRPAFFSPTTKEMLETLSQTIEWTGRIFPSTDRIKQMINEMLVELNLKNGKDGRGCHTYRHWIATKLFYDAEMRLEDIAMLLGDQVDTIREHYLHPTPKMLQKKVVKAMGWEI